MVTHTRKEHFGVTLHVQIHKTKPSRNCAFKWNASDNFSI